MPRLALVTSSKFPTLTEDDRLLLDPLSQHGIQAQPAIWNLPAQDWSQFAAVLIRSCWDYHLAPEKFLDWIAQLESEHIPILNPAPLIRWNAHKGYLRDLDTRGIPIVPTFWPEQIAGPVLLREKLRELGWRKAAVKPRISATAYRTQLVTQEDAATAQPLAVAAARSAVVCWCRSAPGASSSVRLETGVPPNGTSNGAPESA